MRTNRFDIQRMTRSNTGGGGGVAIAPYVLPVAADGVLGGIQLGYPTGTDKYYPVQLDDQQRAFVNVPWTSVSFGTDGDDYVPITIGGTTKNVLTSHQSLDGYATESWVTQRGYATESWVSQNYLSIEWFDKLFKLYNGEESEANKIAPNGTLPSDTANLNIEAMFGFWTKKYISALGQGDDGGTTIQTLAQLNDVALTSPTNGQALVYDASTSKWVNGTVQGGTDMATVWSALAANTNEQIALSHLTTALSGYATASQLANYLPLSGGTMTGGFSISFNSGYAIECYGVGESSIEFFVNGTSKGVVGALSGVFLYNRARSNYLSYNDDGTLTFEGYTVVHSGNVSQYIGDVIENSYYNYTNRISESSFETAIKSGFYNVVADSGSTSILANTAYGNSALHVCWDNGTNIAGFDFLINDSNSSNLYFRTRVGGGIGGWRTIIDSNNIGSQSVSSATNATYATRLSTPRSLWGNSFDGSADISGAISAPYVITTNDTGFYANSPARESGIDFRINGNYRTVIGTWTDSSFWWMDEFGACFVISRSTGYMGIGTTNPSYKLHVAGDIYATGGVTALSDIRHKNVVSDVNLTVEQIASMRAINYYWKDGREDKSLHVGSIAQDWERVMPEVVLRANDAEHTLSLQYGVAALVASIINARKLVNHEKRITDLERECERLRTENERLRLKIA